MPEGGGWGLADPRRSAGARRRRPRWWCAASAHTETSPTHCCGCVTRRWPQATECPDAHPRPAARATRLGAGRARRAGHRQGAVSAEAMTSGPRRRGDPVAELDAVRARAAPRCPRRGSRGRAAAARHASHRAEAGRAGQPLAENAWAGSGGSTRRTSSLNMGSVDGEISQIAQLAEATRLPLIRWHLLRQQASRAALAGQFDLARKQSWAAYRLAVRLQDPSAAGLAYAFAVILAPCAATPVTYLPKYGGDRRLPGATDRPGGPGHRRCFFTGPGPRRLKAIYATLRSLPGQPATSDNQECGRHAPKVLDLVIAFRDHETAQAAYDLLRPPRGRRRCHRHRGRGALRVTALAARAAGGHAGASSRTALVHHATAVTINTKLGARPFVALARLDWADALRSRAAPEGSARRHSLLARQAATETRRLDMPGHGRAPRRGWCACCSRPTAGRRIQLTPPRARDSRARCRPGLPTGRSLTRLVLSERTWRATSGTC